MGFFNCSMFCCALLCVHSSSAIISIGEGRTGCFALFVFLVSCDSYVALPYDATGLPQFVVVFFSNSYSLTIFVRYT